MNARRQAALLGIDPDRGRRERKSNIVNARANAREERLNHRRRVESDDPGQHAPFAQDSNVGGAARSLEDLSGNVRCQLHAIQLFMFALSWTLMCARNCSPCDARRREHACYF